MTFKPGDPCRFTIRRRDGELETIDAVVHLVSAEGRPLAFLFDGVVETFAGWLPVIWTDGECRTFHGTTLEHIEPRHA